MIGPNPEESPMIRLMLDSGTSIDWPSAETAAEMAGLLGPRMEYLTISRTSGEFVQAAWCAPASSGGSAEYLLEAKPAPGAALVGTRLRDLAPVCEAFSSFTGGDWGWMEAHDWSSVEWSGPADR